MIVGLVYDKRNVQGLDGATEIIMYFQFLFRHQG